MQEKNLKGFAILLLILTAQSLLTKSQPIENETTNKTVHCEQIKIVQWSFLGFQKITCLMTNKTTIDSDDYQFGRFEDKNFEVLSFSFNDKIEYLPKSSREISNVEVYAAPHCAIKKISHKNFEGLKNLSILWLSWNQIETIQSETFCDLTSLTELYLRKRRKKY
jgi:Leucine-rich repeat (LRR) protein